MQANGTDPKSSDRRRLSQIQTQDLTESRVNEDFVYWLKNRGPNLLLVVLLGACAVLGFQYWQRKSAEKSSAAWSDLAVATLPEAYEELAKKHADVTQASMLAWMRAGDLRLGQLQSGVQTPAQGDTPAVPLDESGRKIAQDAADEDFVNAANAAIKLAGGDRASAALVVIPSLFGRAAVAESRGDFDGAKKFLEEASALAGERWPQFANLAKTRVDGLVALASPMPLPKAAELPLKTPEVPPAPAGGGIDELSTLDLTPTPAPSEPAPVDPLAPVPAPAPGNGG